MRVLFIDDEQWLSELVSEYLAAKGFEVVSSPNGEAALELLARERFDAAVADIRLPGMSGLDLCDEISAHWPNLPVVVITGFANMESAVAALRNGAFDFIAKPEETARLAATLETTLHRAVEKRTAVLASGDAVVAKRRGDFHGLIGSSEPMLRLRGLIERSAAVDLPVLTTGAPGTGKELVARAIHASGRRSAHPFVVVNCAAMPLPLLENELFGHVGGTRIYGGSTRDGVLAEAGEGTVFLEEVGQIPTSLQQKLVRVIQEGRVRGLGGSGEHPLRARIIAANSRDLRELVEKGEFRDDLYFRLNVLSIELPPLTERGNDVLLLAQAFLDRGTRNSNAPLVGFTSQAAAKLLAYSWPGNVRELLNCVERAVALASQERITIEDLPERIRDYDANEIVVTGTSADELLPMAEVERRYIKRVLDLLGGNKTVAARALGLDRKTLYRKLERYGISPSDA